MTLFASNEAPIKEFNNNKGNSYKSTYKTIDDKIEPFLERVNCKACNSDDSTTIFNASGLEMAKCNNCGTNFVSVRLKKDALDQVFYKNWIPSMFLTGGEEKTKNRIKDAEFQLDFINELKPTGKVLDVGAAAGTFLSVAKEKGWEIRGTDLSDKCIEKAKEVYGIEIFKGDVEEFKEEGFDLIVLWNTLEHLYEPFKEFKHLVGLLKKGGYFLIKIPAHNKETLFNQHMLPAHVFNFTKKSIEYFLKQFDLNIVKIMEDKDGEIPTLILAVEK